MTERTPVGHEAEAYHVPLHELLGIKGLSMAPDGTAEMGFTVDPEKHLGAGMVHGGLAPLLMDACAGMAAMGMLLAAPEKRYVRATINLTCAYHRPIGMGEVVAKCKVVHISSRHAHVSGEVWAGGKLCASGTVTLVLGQGEFPGPHDGRVPSEVVRDLAGHEEAT